MGPWKKRGVKWGWALLKKFVCHNLIFPQIWTHTKKVWFLTKEIFSRKFPIFYFPPRKIFGRDFGPQKGKCGVLLHELIFRGREILSRIFSLRSDCSPFLGKNKVWD